MKQCGCDQGCLENCFRSYLSQFRERFVSPWFYSDLALPSGSWFKELI